ncbi:hypothetical protein J4402_04705 [Candidatus Pacearchaeota archaeon]|nr:hypothetical protein [Candidatus Pacearchaeota archaeon]
MDKKIIICLIAMIYLIGFVSAGETVSMSDVTVCCEKTNSGLYCQDVREEDCSPDANALPTACASTSFCKPGFCFDSVEGTCLDNVPQMVCNNEDGTWKSEMPAQCELGCCVLGDQASFVTLTRCKRLSSMFGLETNYNKNLKDELQCVMSARADEKGACVYVANPADAQPTCKFVTRSECESESSTSAGEEIKEKESSENESVLEEALGGEEKYGGTLLSPSDAEFHAGLLCSAEELGTDCGMTKETICLAGHEEVYFADTCGNPANIYDASKVNDKRYWSEIIDKAESCNPDASNGGSQTCGNCNYILGAVCRESSSTTGRATYGDNVCADLGCEDGKGEEQMHGESWCVSPGADKVGSKYYRHSCVNNEVLSEPCAEFRNEICIENTISTSEGDFTQAACRVNRWQDCTAQKTSEDCTNNDRRDCIWLDGIEYVLMGAAMNGSTIDKNSLGALREQVKAAGGLKEIPRGACVPEHPPGLEFYGETATSTATTEGTATTAKTGDDSLGVCGQANAVCPVKYEKGLIGGEWECVEHCECLPGGELEQKRVQLCKSMGDCGPKTNYIGVSGSGKGYEVKEVENEKKKD